MKTPGPTDGFGIGYTSLPWLPNGGESGGEPRLRQQLCTHAAEKAILRLIMEFDRCGFTVKNYSCEASRTVEPPVIA